MNKRPDRHKSQLVAVLPAVLIALGAVMPAEAEPFAFEPDQGIQALIAEFAHADNTQIRGTTLDAVKAAAAASPEPFVRQATYFASRAESSRDTMAVGVLMHELDLPATTMARALAPMLDSDDDRLTKSVRNTLASIEDQSAGRAPDFSIYRDLIEADIRNGQQPPDGLIEHMYRVHPGQALLALMRAHQLRRPDEIKPILWAEHTVSDTLWKQRYGFLKPEEVDPAATQELHHLADHNAWWARLYVAETMRQNPAFQQEDLLDRLANDGNGLVRHAIAATRDQQ